MNAFELTNVSKWYRKDFWASRKCAVSNVSFVVKKERVTGFIGPNGAGKTTSIKMIMGLVIPDSGTVTLYGVKAGLPQSRSGIAYLSEQPYFYGHLTVEESLRFAGDLLGLAKTTMGSEIERVLSLVDLTGNNRSKVKGLSKGMQQRLNMAQALLGKPHTLILDEPMSGMDPPGRRLFRMLFKKLADDGVTIFFSTHILDDVEAGCDDVVVLSKGALYYSGKVESLLEKGLQGEDMVVCGLTDDCVKKVAAVGCQVSEVKEHYQTIFVPTGTDSEMVQDILR